jgi:hypothetical protein
MSKNMKSESIPPALRNLLTKLEYISMIERGQKPCFSDMTFVQSNSWFGAWKRLFSGENKKNLLFEIEQIIDRTILAIEEYSNKEYMKLLLDNLAKAKVGIENLILTYTEHPETISNLRVHIINIDLTLKKYGYINENGKVTKPEDINNFVASQTTYVNDELQKLIDNFDLRQKKSQPLPIVNIESVKSTNSFKRFTPKDYIEKHILSTSTSSSDTKNISKISETDFKEENNE